MIIGFLSIFEGIAMVVTLGFYTPMWIWNFVSWNEIRELKIAIRKDEEGLKKRGIL